jgi:translation initiation factor 2B subunit (eIF-2B alpha/beta/delta family)
VFVVPFLQEALDVVTADLYFLYLELGVFALCLACQHLTVNVFYCLGLKINRNVLLARVVDVVDHVCLLLLRY